MQKRSKRLYWVSGYTDYIYWHISSFTASLFSAEPIRCRPGFVPIQGGCYLFNTTAQFTWHEASQACSKNGTRFAVVDRANLLGAVTDYLYAMRSAPNTLLIGLVSRQQWSWIGNKTVNSSLWMPNFPKANPSGLSCAVLPPASSKLISTACTKPSQFVCQTSESKYELSSIR